MAGTSTKRAAAKKDTAIDLREGDRIDTAALEALLREAVACNSKHSVPKSRASRTWNASSDSA